MKKKQPRRGNKYQSFSHVGKESTGPVKNIRYGDCPACDCCRSQIHEGKSALCTNCSKGWDSHKKLGKPKGISEKSKIVLTRGENVSKMESLGA